MAIDLTKANPKPENFSPAGAQQQREKFDAFKALSGPERALSELRSELPLSFGGHALVVCDASNSKDVAIALSKFAILAGKKPVIVLLNYNYKTMRDFLKNYSITEGFFLIDSVSKSVSRVTETDEVLFVDSPRNLTQLEIKMVNLMEKNPSLCFVFDSVGLLSLYHEDEVVSKFIYSATRIMRKKGAASFFVSAGKASAGVEQFFDDIIEIKKFF